MGKYDTYNLVNDAFFETEIFPDLYWVPLSILGKSKVIFTQDLLYKIKQDIEFIKIIKNPYEFIQYLQASDFQEYMDVAYHNMNDIRWEIHSSGLEALRFNCGTCSSISGAFFRVLKEHYKSMGILGVFSNSGVGHTINYIKQNDFIYFVDPYAQLNKFISYIPIETGEKKDFARSKYITGICIRTKNITNFINFFEKYNILKKKEFLFFTYELERCPPISIQTEKDQLRLVFPKNAPLKIISAKGDKIKYQFKEYSL